MEAPIAHRPSSALRWFSGLLRLASGFLILVTAVGVPFGLYAASGRGGMDIEVRFEPPYSIGLDPTDTDFPGPADAGRRIDVGEDGIGAYVNFPQGEESLELQQAPSVGGKVAVGREDRDARWLLLGMLASWLVLTWIGLENLRRVVAAARDGDPFDGRNVARLRRVAAVALAFPVVSWIFLRLVDGAFDSSLPVSVDSGTAGATWLVIGLGLLALAEVFRAGAELRELERSTV